MNKFESGDYVIAKPAGQGKNFLFKVSGIDQGIVAGTLEKDSHVKGLRKTVEIPKSDIIVNLGRDPFPGKAYDCDATIIYKGRKTHDQFGTLFWFYKPETDVAERIMKSFDRAARILKQHDLDFTIEPEKGIWEIQRYNGEKYCGLYKHSRDTEKNPHRFVFRPEMVEPKDYNWVILHEHSHHIERAFLHSKSLRGQWVQLYNSTILVEDIEKKTCKDLLERILGQEDLPSDFKGQLEEDEQIQLKWILKHIKQQHKLSIKELDMLFDAGMKDDIRDVWPVSGVSMNDLKPLVTEYATKSWKELWAESLSLYFCGVKLPKVVVALIEKSLSHVRTQNENK
jgi:hypothetical protein